MATIRRIAKPSDQIVLPFAGYEEEVAVPSTRYQGSKAKLLGWIWDNIRELGFSSALDIFGGTGVVGYLLKQKGKEVHYNDYLRSNYYVGLALIENNNVRLSTDEVERLLIKDPDYDYRHFIQETFKDIYYTDEENLWLDVTVQNIRKIKDTHKKAVAYYALFQACLVKRPFNLFHRRNLYLRFADVRRTFGNKATWDRPFHEHFLDFIHEINRLVRDNGRQNRAYNLDVFDVRGDFDLVYIDPPYISSKGVSVDYLDFYHFLEGLADYDRWKDMINYRTINRRFRRHDNPWNDKLRIRLKFRELFEKFRGSILVVSYRSDGIPSLKQLVSDLRMFKSRVRVYTFDDYKYVLSNAPTSEALIVAE